MNNTITKKEFITLKHLSDGKQHNDAPERLTSTQYCVALKALKTKDMVRACFEEGGGVVSAQITKLGQAILDDLKEEEEKQLRRILRQLKITQSQYKLLCRIKESGGLENLIDNNWKDIGVPLYTNEYIKMIPGSDESPFVVTDKGEDLLQEIDDLLDDDQEYMSNIDTHQAEQVSKENVAEQPKKTKASDIRVANGHLADVIKIFQAMCDLNYFEDANENKATTKRVMEIFGEALNAEQFKNYSSNLNKASKATKNTYMQTFINLEEQAENFYDNKNKRKINKV